MKVYRQWVPCERNSSYNFILIFLKLCTCFLSGLEMCMWFGYNPWINFCHFFLFVNFVIFLTSDFMKVYRQWVPCKHNSLYNFNPFFMQLYTSFFHGLKMCMWFGFNPAVNFCHFSTLLTLSFFNFLQVRHQIHRSSIYIFILRLPELCYYRVCWRQYTTTRTCHYHWNYLRYLI